MGAASIQQMADRVAVLMEERLRIRGDGLEAKIRKAGRLLPAKVRAKAEYLSKASEMARNPKLLVRVDEAKVAEAYDACVRYLGQVSPGERRISALIGIAASVAFSLLVVVLLVLAVLYWRGFV